MFVNLEQIWLFSDQEIITSVNYNFQLNDQLYGLKIIEFASIFHELKVNASNWISVSNKSPFNFQRKVRHQKSI